jgi:DnaD/phage-associated family protein
LAWIELHQSLWTHKKTIMLAAELDIPDMLAAAHIARLWTWALDNAPNGDLTGLPNRVVAVGAGWTGDPDAFVNALIRAGWLDREDDRLMIHDWHDYAGRLIEKREQDRERKRKSRGRHADVTRTNEGSHADVQRNLTVPNHTIPDINTPTTTNARDEEKDAQVFRVFEQEGFGTLSSVLVDDLRDMIDTYSAEWVIRAMHEAVRSGKRNLRYARAILKRWKNEGIDTPWEVKRNAEHGRSNQRGVGEFDFLSL